MKIENVVKRFEKVSGLETKDVLRWSFLCEDAVSYIRSILKDKEYEFLYSEILEKASGGYAFFLYSIYAKFDDIKSFKAGEIEMDIDTLALKERAKDVWENEKENIAPFVFSDNFCFKRVK
ncbi:MAG: hypothetical protein ACI4QE_00850 [Acutalibacteraceae bacterium]